MALTAERIARHQAALADTVDECNHEDGLQTPAPASTVGRTGKRMFYGRESSVNILNPSADLRSLIQDGTSQCAPSQVALSRGGPRKRSYKATTAVLTAAADAGASSYHPDMASCITGAPASEVSVAPSSSVSRAASSKPRRATAPSFVIPTPSGAPSTRRKSVGFHRSCSFAAGRRYPKEHFPNDGRPEAP
eukprot:Hpha_TRINITY_DN15240_c3_g1::TRINITY_DN15240_c3_g1_i1::g.66143::m.66143